MASTEQPGPVRKRVVYHGHVQGVCFRALTAEIARRFEVAGYVRNLPDGTVELEAEGTAEEVERFLKAVAQRFMRNITHSDAAERPAEGTKAGFEIRY